MTLKAHHTGIPANQPDPDRPTDPRPAWERVAYAWLAREVDAGQPVDPATLAGEVGVAPDLARDLLRLLRGQRDRDPGLAELRARLVRDRITDAYLRRELAGDQRLDPAELAAEVGTTTTIARHWLASLRHQERDGGVLVEPVSHGRPTPEQLAGLQAHFAAGGHQQAAVAGRPPDPERLAAEVERHYWTREVRAGQRLRPARLARELGGDQRQISRQLAELRAGPSTASERIAQLWHAHQQDSVARPLSSSRLAWRLGVSDSYVRHRTWQLRTRTRQAPLAERLAATQKQLASPPPKAEHMNGERDWRLDAACADVDPELFFPGPGQVPQTARPSRCAPAARFAVPAWRPPCTAPRPATTTPGSSPAPPPESAWPYVAVPPTRRAPSSCRIGPRPRRRWRWPTRSASTGPPRNWAYPSRRCGAPSTTTACRSPRCSRAAQGGRASTRTGRRPSRRGGGRPRSASTRPARSWASPIGRCGMPGGGTAWVCHPVPAATAGQARGGWMRRSSLNRRLLPARARSEQELAARVRRGEEYAALGAEVVVEMGSETYGKRPAARAWAITRRAQRAQRRTVDRQGRTERRQADRASRTDRTSRARAPVQEREVTADAR